MRVRLKVRREQNQGRKGGGGSVDPSGCQLCLEWGPGGWPIFDARGAFFAPAEVCGCLVWAGVSLG